MTCAYGVVGLAIPSIGMMITLATGEREPSAASDHNHAGQSPDRAAR
jgi:hypothetical protein